MRIENSRQLASFAADVRQQNDRKSQFDVTVFVDGMVRGSGSLLLQVNPSGAMQFRYMQRYRGKREFIKIGSYTGETKELILAQEQARKYGDLASDLRGECSVKSKLKQLEVAMEIKLAEENSVGTVGELIEDYCRTYAQVKKQLLLNFDTYLGRKANSITSLEISSIIAQMIERNALVQANRIRAYLHAMFAFAIKFDHDPLHVNRCIKYKIANNPVTSVPRQHHAEKCRDRVLTNQELKCLFAGCNGSEFSIKISCLVRLLFLLGGQRPNELLASQWQHFDMQTRLWNLPGTLTKNKKAHVVPITSTAQKLLTELRQLTGHSEYLFPQVCGQKSMTTQALSQAIRKFCNEQKLPKFQPRDFRRTVKTKLGELGVSKLDRDRIQNHVLSDISTRHYDRYDYLEEKKLALQSWEKWLVDAGI